MVQHCARKVGKGVIYVDVSPMLDDFINDLASAISFRDNESFVDSLTQRILGKCESCKVIVKKYLCLLCTHSLLVL